VTKRRILVVDDDPSARRLIKLRLSRAGYDVVTASTGEEGIQIVRTAEPDLVLMDVMMPGMGGFEATKHIRRLPGGRQMPIVFLSALDRTEAKVKGLRMGGNDYIAKPIKAGELLARVEARLRSEAPAGGHLLTVCGSKAGVGTTTLMINLALALHNVSQKSVLLVDWRRPVGDIALFLGLPKGHSLEPLLPCADGLDENRLDSVLEEYRSGVWVLPGASNPASAGEMHNKALGNILQTALAKADYILVDGGPFYSLEGPPLIAKGEDIQPTVLIPDLTLCVLTPDLVAVERAANATSGLNATNGGFWFLLNREGLPGGLPSKQITSCLGTSLQGCVPDESDQVTAALNEGQPVYLVNPDSGFSRAVEDIATRIHETLAQY
jgi:CheY-like chemotaxis protein